MNNIESGNVVTPSAFPAIFCVTTALLPSCAKRRVKGAVVFPIWQLNTDISISCQIKISLIQIEIHVFERKISVFLQQLEISAFEIEIFLIKLEISVFELDISVFELKISLFKCRYLY